MHVSELIKRHIEESGAEGLVNIDSECGCSKDDLFPGYECPGTACQPGWLGADTTGEWGEIGEKCVYYVSKTKADQSILETERHST